MTATLDPRLDIDAARRRLETLTVDDAERSIEEHAAGVAHHRMLREPRPRSGPQPRCPACHRFVSSPLAPCACGFTPGQGYAG